MDETKENIKIMIDRINNETVLNNISVIIQSYLKRLTSERKNGEE